LGEIDAVFEWLQRAIDDRDVHILLLPCKPIWDGMRNEPRFLELPADALGMTGLPWWIRAGQPQ
jgi:hypothetical protein